MKQTIYQVDAFAENIFEGNPAAVCIMDSWPAEDLMQRIAMENNLSETAFVVARENIFEIRWFTPGTEVALCGHATLASAYVLFNFGHVSGIKIEFFSPKSGPLYVEKGENGLLVLDFPADVMEAVEPYEELSQAMGKMPVESWKGKTDYMLVYEKQEDIEGIEPDFFRLNQVEARGVIVTAPGREVDFVSRFFAPQAGVNEDPVTGSAHTSLTPYWSGRLGKDELTARQLSKRGGSLICTNLPPRVKIAGKGVLYLKGEIEV